jgi:hypothetical protein
MSKICISIDFDASCVQVFGPKRRTTPVRRLRFAVSGPNHNHPKIIGSELMITLTDVQKFNAALQPLDAVGNPAKVESATWSSSSDIVTVVPSEDGLSATISATGPLGQAQITVKADALIGEGEAELIGTLDVEVVGSQAVTLGIATSAPEPIAA